MEAQVQLDTINQICLADIAPSKRNPRKIFAGVEYDELMESIRNKGVIQPIIVRLRGPEHNTMKAYEIVAGERRYRASCDLARENGGVTKHTIPAIVRAMSDDEAFDIMQIENLQREDLTPLEEARSYKCFLKGKGPEAIDDLATRLGTDPRNIRRRLAVLALPKEILASWDEGVITIGHLEQVMRFEDTKNQMTVFENITKNNLSVNGAKKLISDNIFALSTAFFDLVEAGCATCPKNTDSQKALFGEDIADDARCLDSKCFKEKQTGALTTASAWEKFKKKHKLQTNGFVMRTDLVYDKYESIWWDVKSACLECQFCVSALDDRYVPGQHPVCTGDKSCFKKEYHQSSSGGERKKAEKKAEDAPRVDWHGEYFREVFYQTRLSSISLVDLRYVLLTLCILHSGVKSKICGGERQGYVAQHEILPIILDLEKNPESFCGLFEDAMEMIITDMTRVEPAVRHQVALSEGVDLSKEWVMTPEYLEKKSTNELKKMITKLKIDQDPLAIAYLTKLGEKAEVASFAKLKKAGIIRLILESGINRVGLVPDEILAVDLKVNNTFRYKKLFDGPSPFANGMTHVADAHKKGGSDDPEGEWNGEGEEEE